MSILKYVVSTTTSTSTTRSINITEEDDSYTNSEELNTKGRGKSKEKYREFTGELRYEIGRYAAEHSNVSAVKKYGAKESTVRLFKNKYLAELKKTTKSLMQAEAQADSTSASISFVVATKKTIPTKQRGRTSLLGNELDKKLVNYIMRIRRAGGCVNSSMVIAAAQGLLKKDRPYLLGSLSLTKSWAHYQLKRLGFTKRRATKSGRKRPKDIAQVKCEFSAKVKAEIQKYNIPPELTFNFDQTGISFVPCSQWTMAKRGVKQVEMVGLDDKRQITALLTVSASGSLLPPQVLVVQFTTVLSITRLKIFHLFLNVYKITYFLLFLIF